MTSSADESAATDRSLPDVPRLIFLDSNIVQNLASFGEFIYENGPVTDVDSKLENKGQDIRDDVLALAELMDLGRRGGLPFVISPRVAEELSVPRRSLAKRQQLAFSSNEWSHYSSGLLEAVAEESDSSSSPRAIRVNPRQRRCGPESMSTLRDEGDRQLMVDALELGCDAFLTMDYKIWDARDSIRRFGIRVLRPVELMNEMRPLAGLVR
ncbi:hypothetical protein [Candidatus Poriferisodalis sp.]|uniref:hypothetical protein n=1 Tax=Candidatus Poriferisodalis sp. TaxID=3101277 RepID=UPI003B02361B